MNVVVVELIIFYIIIIVVLIETPPARFCQTVLLEPLFFQNLEVYIGKWWPGKSCPFVVGAFSYGLQGRI